MIKIVLVQFRGLNRNSSERPGASNAFAELFDLIAKNMKSKREL